MPQTMVPRATRHPDDTETHIERINVQKPGESVATGEGAGGVFHPAIEVPPELPALPAPDEQLLLPAPDEDVATDD